MNVGVPATERGRKGPRFSTSELLEALDALKTERSATQRREAVQHVFERLKQAFLEAGGAYHADVNEIYRKYSADEELVVRREDPLAITQAVLQHRDLPVGSGVAPGGTGGNSVVWRRGDGEQGLATAFLEGHGTAGGLATVVGFRKGADLELRSVPRSAADLRGSRRHVRSATGTVHPDEIEFIIVRVPATHFPKQEMTEEETDSYEEEIESGHKKRMQILRGFSFRDRGAEERPQAAE